MAPYAPHDAPTATARRSPVALTGKGVRIAVPYAAAGAALLWLASQGWGYLDGRLSAAQARADQAHQAAMAAATDASTCRAELARTADRIAAISEQVRAGNERVLAELADVRSRLSSIEASLRRAP